MRTPQDYFFSQHHLWAKPAEDGIWLAGVTDYAQDMLGDVVFVDAPKVGSQLKANASCGLIESVKTGSDLHALVDGEVVAINQALADTPEAINDKPYQAWIFKFKPSLPDVGATLMGAEAYDAFIGKL